MDRGYVDFARLYAIHSAQAFFVIRAKSNMQYRCIASHPVDKHAGLRCDQRIVLCGRFTAAEFPSALRRVKFYDAVNDKLLVFVTNHFGLPALSVKRSIVVAGRSNCSSNGSSNTCASKRSSAPPRTP